MIFTQKNWANLSTASTLALIFIWVLPNTIALRHLLLGLGSIAGIFLIKGAPRYLYDFKLRLTPLYAILGLFIWVGIHYYFFSLNPSLQLSEIKGLWLRTLAGSIMAIGLGISLWKYPSLRKYFFVSVFFVPIINIGAYLYDSYLLGAFVNPNAFVFFLFAKIETAYFGGLAVSVSVASIAFCILNPKTPKKYIQIFLYMLGLLLVLISDTVSNTKNGILIAMLMSFLLVAIVFFHALFFAKSRNAKILGIAVIIFVVIGSSFIWHTHKKLAYKGWDTLLQDTQIAMDIDSNKQWSYIEGTHGVPLNPQGLPVAQNVYVRVAWATVGMRLIAQYPLGYGSINQSFNGLQTYANVPHEHTGQAHSGWVDFGMAFGIPGLLLIFCSIFFTGVFAMVRPNQLRLTGMMIGFMLIPFCLTAEMSYKQYFESMIFFLTLSATFVALPEEGLT